MGTFYVEVGSVGGGVIDSRWDLFLPAAPTGLTATAGNASATLSWTAPTGVIAQAPITDYREQYSTDGGTTWTTFTGAAASTAATATVTGLTNGQAVRFRVAAVNAVGTGTYTAASSSVTPGAAATVTGGTVLTPGDGYTYRTFTSSGTLNISGASLTADVLVVGGGGSGGRNFGGGGGGGGGVLYRTNQSIATGSYAVAVAITTALNASAGSSSIGSLYSATGGGAGVGLGGSYYGATAGGSSGLPTSSSNVTANAGGTGDEEFDYGGGGQGGGAGGVGANGIRGQRVNSANGRTVFGVEYGRGGRGGFNSAGGGDQLAYNGASNTGNGGSGGGDAFGDGARGTGGSGIVIIRYLTA